MGCLNYKFELLREYLKESQIFIKVEEPCNALIETFLTLLLDFF